MQNITGSPVREENFFNRENLITEMWQSIKNGLHILIAAPRRVGKTSLMFYLMDHPEPHHSFVYLITESINNENEFYRRLVNKIIKSDFIKRSQKVVSFLEQHLPSIKKIGVDGVEFGLKEEHDYYEMLKRILQSETDKTEKLVVMIDEFPETLENIVNDEGASPGRHFLQSNRELRQDPEISKNIVFIYTGSIGLENVVSKLNAMSTINDLKRLQIPPLTETETKQLLSLLEKNKSFKLADTVKDYIIQKIEWLIPFYIQLVFEQMGHICRETRLVNVTDETVDRALNNMLEQRNHFEHWHTRLRAVLPSNQYKFVKDVLNIAAENGSVHRNEIIDCAVKYQLENEYKDLLSRLVYDGYINNHDDLKVYRYNSPILKLWWRQNVAN